MSPGQRLDPVRSGCGPGIRPPGYAAVEGRSASRFSVGKERLTVGGTEQCSSSCAPAVAIA
jgi:hypothetical protein